jgi:uncharacterized protein YneR
MNAYELASTIEEEIKAGFGMGFMPHAIKMLREQADQIAELKNSRDYWCFQYKDVFNKLEAQEK